MVSVSAGLCEPKTLMMSPGCGGFVCRGGQQAGGVGGSGGVGCGWHMAPVDPPGLSSRFMYTPDDDKC